MTAVHEFCALEIPGHDQHPVAVCRGETAKLGVLFTWEFFEVVPDYFCEDEDFTLIKLEQFGIADDIFTVLVVDNEGEEVPDIVQPCCLGEKLAFPGTVVVQVASLCRVEECKRNLLYFFA